MGIVDLGIEDDDIEESNAILQLSNSLTFTMIDVCSAAEEHIRIPTEILRK